MQEGTAAGGRGSGRLVILEESRALRHAVVREAQRVPAIRGRVYTTQGVNRTCGQEVWVGGAYSEQISSSPILSRGPTGSKCDRRMRTLNCILSRACRMRKELSRAWSKLPLAKGRFARLVKVLGFGP